MLNYMRAASKTWVAKTLLGLLLLSFMMWGIPQAFYNQDSNILYQSDKSSASLADYQFLAQNEATKYYLMTGQYINPNQFASSGLAQQILQRLKANVLIDEEAKRMKINIGQKGTLRVLSQEQIFHGINGNFDKDRFERFLQQTNITQNAYLDQLAKTGIRNQITTSISDNILVPNVFSSAVVLNNHELRDIDYITITPSSIGAIADPSPEVLTAWYKTNKVNFRAPEYRKATYVTLTPSALAKPSAISDEEIKKSYQTEISKFTKPETRIIEELRFDTRQAADDAEQKLKNGMDFEELTTTLHQDLNKIRKKPLTKAELPTLVAPVVFDLKEGQVSSVINDLQGPIIVRVTNITPAIETPLDKVSEEIRQELAMNKARQDLSDMVKTINDEQYEGLSLSEIAQKHNLPIKTITVDPQGNDLEDKAVEISINKNNLIDGIFKATVGIDNDPLTGNDGVQWYQIDELIASRDRTLDEVHSKVIAAWKKQETDRLVTEKVKDLHAELNKGKTLAQIAHENNLEVSQATALTRLSKDTNLSVQAIKAIFSGPNESTGTAPSKDEQSKLIFKVTNTTEPASTNPDLLDKTTKQQFTLSLSQDVLSQYIQALEINHPIQTNAKNIQRIFINQ